MAILQNAGCVDQGWPRDAAREYSFWEKKSGTYAPATSTHILNLLPMMYLQGLANVSDDTRNASEPLCLGTLDVKMRSSW